MNRPLTDMPWTKPCRYPGCKALLRKNTNTYDVGLCREHGGLRRGRARDLPRAVPPEAPERPGIRQVEVPATSAPAGGSADTWRRIKVSLPKEPWQQ